MGELVGGIIAIIMCVAMFVGATCIGFNQNLKKL